MSLKKFKKNIRQGRLWQSLRISFRFTRRKIRRFFTGDNFRAAALGSFAKKFYAALAILLLSVLCILGAHRANIHIRDTEGMILDKLTYGEDYDASVPYFRTLDAIGSSNHLCVTVKTGSIDNLADRTPTLEDGGVNLRVTFTDGTSSELSLYKKFRSDSFSSGKETHFIVTLPYGYTPFDISATALTITPGKDGSYDDWLCRSASVSFMLSGKRVLISYSDAAKRLGSGTDMLRSLELTDARKDNTTYGQMSLLFDKLVTLAEAGLTDFSDTALKQDTLTSLGLSNATALYLDIETVSTTRNAELHAAEDQNGRLPESEDLNYNGTLTAEVTFTTELADGGYTKTYTLDTPGKDDFEMSASSTFRMDMPDGMCVFDVASITITTTDKNDAWAPRFVRLYLTLDYAQELELARLTDKKLEQQYDSCIFYKGYLDSAVSFDISAANAIPAIEADSIKESYGHTLSEAAYNMYFETQSYYSRQIRFYEQAAKLIDKKS